MAQLEKLIESTIHKEIPLSVHIGLKVNTFRETGVTVSAPFENNKNHMETVFGGSLYSICVLAGWALLYGKLQIISQKGHIVIFRSNIEYLRPVSKNIICTAQLLDTDENSFVKFIKRYSKKGKARISVKSEIVENGILLVRFQGEYVVHN